MNIAKPSGHLLEIYMPYLYDEPRMLDVAMRETEDGFYQNIEIGICFDGKNQASMRRFLESNALTATTFAAPYLNKAGLNLSSTDKSIRRKAINAVKDLSSYAADCGYMNLGVSSGNDVPEPEREKTLLEFAEALIEIAEHQRKLGMFMTLEPLDRFAFKKKLVGEISETVQWFPTVKKACPNAFLHWDSAHEILNDADLFSSLDASAPYLAHVHLCNVILDKKHPCYGDLHMDCGTAPDFATEGFLSAAYGGDMIRKVEAFTLPEGIKKINVSLEALGHPGDDLVLKAHNAKEFLKECFRLAEEV